MNTGAAIRDRTVAIDQRALSTRLDAFRDKAGLSAQTLLDRGKCDLAKLQAAATQTNSRTTVASQAVEKSILRNWFARASEATAHVKTSESPRLSSSPALAHAHASSTQALPSESASAKMRAFLFNPAHRALRDARMPEIEKKGMKESVQFLQDLQALREHPTVERATYIKTTYIDSANQEFDFSSVSADSFGKDLQSKALNITARHQSQFNEEFASCLNHIERGDSVQQSGLIQTFKAIEEHIAHLVLRNVSL